jgi:RimJ/RimL family protein N-acetyltransferase
MIRTDRLDLVPATAALLNAELADAGQFRVAIGVDVPPDWPPELYDEGAIKHYLALLTGRSGNERWGTYYIARRAMGDEPGVLVGVGGFKGAPDSEGTVEIGYSVVPAHQRRGYATEAAMGFVRFAMAAPAVRRVVAHTLPHLDASINVLRNVGFEYVGVGTDPDAPPGVVVVRYELNARPVAAG